VNPSLLFVLLAAAIAIRSYRSRGAARLERALFVAGAAFVIAQLAVRLGSEAAQLAPATLLGTLAAIASLALWDALVTLALHDQHGRAWIGNAAFGALAAAAFAGSSGLFLPLMLGTLALTRWRSPRGFSARPRWDLPGVRVAAAGAAVVVVLEVVLWLTGRARPTHNAAFRFAAWTCAVAAVQAAQELPAMVRQAALSVRRIGRRLSLLFALAAFVPLALTAALWALTTWLGVGAEDALIAARALRQSATALEQSLAAAHRAEPGLSAYARHWDGAWPGGSLWLRPGPTPHAAGRAHDAQPVWRRLSGADSVDVEALETWQAGDSARVGVLAGRSFLIAKHVGAEDSSVAVALVPVAPLLRGPIASVVGVRLVLESDFPTLRQSRARADSSAEAGNAVMLEPGAADSTLAAHRDELPAGNTRWVIAPRTRGAQSVEAATPTSGLFNGRATVPARIWRQGAWADRFALLAAENDAHRIFLGLYRDVRENPFAVVPLAALLFVFSVFVFVLVFDFRMVRDLGRSVTGAVVTLREGTTALERGDLAHRIKVRGRDDLWEVAGAFNRMAAGLERGRELEAERRRVEGELALARRIQARLLPGAPPAVAGLEIAGFSESAREVGGDYYDHFLMADGRLALAVADVSGKGVPAALLMSAVRAALITQSVEAESPADVLTRIHRLVHRSVEPGRFVTAVLAFLDPDSGRLEYCNAGHNPPMLIAGDGSLERLERGGLVLGIAEDARYETGECTVPPEGLVALFSDGIPEAQSPAGELWDEGPLVALLRGSAGVPLVTLAERVLGGVRAFEAGRPASDDVTLLLVRRR
jgi:serine phosphatase RsbU (regulator of sigma subunit)